MTSSNWVKVTRVVRHIKNFVCDIHDYARFVHSWTRSPDVKMIKMYLLCLWYDLDRLQDECDIRGQVQWYLEQDRLKRQDDEEVEALLNIADEQFE